MSRLRRSRISRESFRQCETLLDFEGPAAGCRSLRVSAPPREFLQCVAAAALLALAACAKPPAEPVKPALWQVEGPRGEKAWLFGTIHALPAPVDWRSGKVDAAIRGSDLLLLEITEDGTDVAETFTRLSRSPGLPPVAERIAPAERPRLAALLKEFGMRPQDLRHSETWAVAMLLSQRAQGAASARHGIEAEVRKAAGDKPVGALEGANVQLGLFDRLAEADQRALLEAVIDEASATGRPDTLGAAWKRGDTAAMEKETRTGMMADPELREALLTGRNRAWSDRIARALARGRRPLVAVGAAHMAGPEGLPALLAAKGYSVKRVQ